MNTKLLLLTIALYIASQSVQSERVKACRDDTHCFSDRCVKLQLYNSVLQQLTSLFLVHKQYAKAPFLLLDCYDHVAV